FLSIYEQISQSILHNNRSLIHQTSAKTQRFLTKMMMKKMFVQIAVICVLATIAAVSAHEGHSHSPAPAPGPASSSAVVSATNMFTGLAFAAVALVLGLNH
ncbi:hypothetical protein EUTSA_v10028231mg, partial [Eutrema salsugineum]